MSRTSRIAILAAATLVVALAGTALATRTPTADRETTPQADEHEAPPDEAAIDRVVDRLAANDIEANPDQVRELAAEHGLGGAVRILAWAQAGASIDDIQARRAAGEGWGEIARALDLDLHPGIGSIMGGGHGRDHAPGQQKDRGADE